MDIWLLAEAETTEVKLMCQDQLTLDVLHLVGLAKLVRGLVAVKADCIVVEKGA